MSSMFSSPATSSSGSIKPADVENHLLIIEPTEYRQGITTTMGPADVIACTIHDVTTQTTHHDVLLFPKVLVGSLKGSIGKRVLGIMGKGVAKAGQSAPWILVDASNDPEATTAAAAYLTAQAATTLTAPEVVTQTAGGIELTPEILAALGNLTGKG